MNLSQFISERTPSNPVQKLILKAIGEGIKSFDFKPATFSQKKILVDGKEISIRTRKGNHYRFIYKTTLEIK